MQLECQICKNTQEFRSSLKDGILLCNTCDTAMVTNPKLASESIPTDSSTSTDRISKDIPREHSIPQSFTNMIFWAFCAFLLLKYFGNGLTQSIVAFLFAWLSAESAIEAIANLWKGHKAHSSTSPNSRDLTESQWKRLDNRGNSASFYFSLSTPFIVTSYVSSLFLRDEYSASYFSTLIVSTISIALLYKGIKIFFRTNFIMAALVSTYFFAVSFILLDYTSINEFYSGFNFGNGNYYEHRIDPNHFQNVNNRGISLSELDEIMEGW